MNLNELAKAGLERKLVEYPSGGALIEHPAEGLLLNFSSNDYLGLSRHPAVVAGAQVALLESGCSASASRLVSGSLELHRLLEVELATFLGFESSLVFGSGALANIGVIGSVVGRHDTVIADKLVHATILDGAILSRARLVRFRHNDLAHLRNLLESHGKSSNGRCLVITESVFSMDGDLAPLVEIVALCREFGARTGTGDRGRSRSPCSRWPVPCRNLREARDLGEMIRNGRRHRDRQPSVAKPPSWLGCVCDCRRRRTRPYP